jgi:hypothetical protein
VQRASEVSPTPNGSRASLGLSTKTASALGHLNSNLNPRHNQVYTKSRPSLPPKPNPSTNAKNSGPEPPSLLSQLKTMHDKRRLEETAGEPIARTDGFGEKPAVKEEGKTPTVMRDERLAIVEELEMGPVSVEAPADDPRFEKMEPNSGIRLRCAVLIRFRFRFRGNGDGMLETSYCCCSLLTIPSLVDSELAYSQTKRLTIISMDVTFSHLRCCTQSYGLRPLGRRTRCRWKATGSLLLS